ncbi:hypothetical protein [Deinococcus fonticola]|uniref:hypothetical protein n=1 Tax=Deinococcus fonticola TaxID=2528713 RepID=UPI0010752B79|nr:hypothetical protein [Deinococcus fonticola]
MPEGTKKASSSPEIAADIAFARECLEQFCATRTNIGFAAARKQLKGADLPRLAAGLAAMVGRPEVDDQRVGIEDLGVSVGGQEGGRYAVFLHGNC